MPLPLTSAIILLIVGLIVCYLCRFIPAGTLNRIIYLLGWIATILGAVFVVWDLVVKFL